MTCRAGLGDPRERGRGARRAEPGGDARDLPGARRRDHGAAHPPLPERSEEWGRWKFEYVSVLVCIISINIETDWKFKSDREIWSSCSELRHFQGNLRSSENTSFKSAKTATIFPEKQTFTTLLKNPNLLNEHGLKFAIGKVQTELSLCRTSSRTLQQISGWENRLRYNRARASMGGS